MTEVVAALIWEGETVSSSASARPTRPGGCLWEFVGGKVEPGETREEALVRECREELDIAGGGGGAAFMEVTHAYPGPYRPPDPVLMPPSRRERPESWSIKDIRWIAGGRDPAVSRFCPADEAILERLREVAGCGGPTQVGR